MIDLVIRDARVAGRHDALTDIGFENGRIAAVEPNLVCEAPSYDAEGCLCCGGLIETHIHLDKSRIIDRCAPEKGRDHNAMKRVSDVKHTMTVEDVTRRARETLEGCITQSSMSIAHLYSSTSACTPSKPRMPTPGSTSTWVRMRVAPCLMQFSKVSFARA